MKRQESVRQVRTLSDRFVNEATGKWGASPEGDPNVREHHRRDHRR
jgi:hypothetical protein